MPYVFISLTASSSPLQLLSPFSYYKGEADNTKAANSEQPVGRYMKVSLFSCVLLFNASKCLFQY